MSERDVVARAQAALEGVTPQRWQAFEDSPGSLVPELVAELVSTRAEVERLRTVIALMRDLHRPTREKDCALRCKECRQHWPCDTSWKLDGLAGAAAAEVERLREVQP